MRHRENRQITDLEPAMLTSSVNINGHVVKVEIQTATSGMIDGKKEILDEMLVTQMVSRLGDVLQQSCSQYNKIPSKIIFERTDSGQAVGDDSQGDSQKDSQGDSTGDTVETARFIESYEPRYELSSVALTDSVRKKIQTALAAVTYRRKITEEWGMSGTLLENRAIILNFYGSPGTGKSMTAEAIAHELHKKVFQVNYSELESKYVGETPKNIKRVFQIAAREDAVIIFDEADSFLGKRLTSVTQSADYGVNITRSVLLLELEKFNGIVIFTTNLMSNYDDAFKRRILLSVCFELPDVKTREQIWKLHLTDKMPLGQGINAEFLAQKYEGLSGADIKDMVFFAALQALQSGSERMDGRVFDDTYKVIRERYQTSDTQSVAQGAVESISVEEIPIEEYERMQRGQDVD